MNEPKFKVGDDVYWAHCGRESVAVPCPVCFGNRRVTVILGDGTHVETRCDYCGHGYEGPRGYVEEYQWVAKPEILTITDFEVIASAKKFEVRYRDYRSYSFNEEDIFATKEEAETRCSEKMVTIQAEEAARVARSKENATKSYSWHVGYHRRQIKDLKRQLEWHEARAAACAALAKTPAQEGGDAK